MSGWRADPGGDRASGARKTPRRVFLHGTAGAVALVLLGCSFRPAASPRSGPPINVFDFRDRARAKLSHAAYEYLEGGAESGRTLRANREVFGRVGIRCRRLVDVSTIDTRVTIFGETYDLPIALAPVGFQGLFHSDGELASASAAAERNLLTMISTASTYSIGEIGAHVRRPLWFQLYPTPDRRITEALLGRAEEAGCPVVVLTVDTPVIGHRETHSNYLGELLEASVVRMGTYEGLRTDEPINDPSMTWEMVDWLRQHTQMRIVLKGIVTAEDARRCVETGVDGIVVSNHGGRQADSGLSTLESLPEVVAAAPELTVLIDSGFRRGTDVFKALAMGARAVAVGRPYLWGLAADGQRGVGEVLDLMRADLVRAMQLAGTRSLAEIEPSFVTGTLR